MAIRHDPTAAESYDRRGQTYARNSAYDRANADYGEAIRLKPAAPFYLHRGVAYQLKGDPDRAIADYDLALTLDGRLALALHNRGMAKWKKNDRTGAANDFAAAIAIEPDLEIAVEHSRALAAEMGSRNGRRAPQLLVPR
jgi:tetratricopeptide (TPR) repeat protein